MYLITTIIMMIFIIWWIIARKEQAVVDEKSLWKPFYQMAQYLYKRMCIRRIQFPQSPQVRKNMEKLYPGVCLEQKVTEYYVKKTALVLVIFIIGILLSVVLKLQTDTGETIGKSGIVLRGSYGENSKKVRLEASLGNHFKDEFKLEIMSRTLDKAEAEKLFLTFWEEIQGKILGKNNNLEHISENLNLDQEWEDYPFSVEWKSSRPEIVSRSGRVAQVQEAEDVLLTARIYYGEWEWVRELKLTVKPPELTAKEHLEAELYKLLQEAEAQGREKNQWNLPDTIEGQKISWKEKKEDNSIVFLILTVMSAVGVFFLSDKDLNDGVEKKKAQMKEAYPVIVNKMTLYLGAGMTIRGAFCKIAENYQTEHKHSKKTQPAYEEMLHTCRELQAGISEGLAYEHFGRRSGLQEYIRLAALLSQNLKKGNSALLGRLKEEAAIATQERIHRRKQAGEEASTKLLVPMMMMLALVMIFVMIPAFSSFGI